MDRGQLDTAELDAAIVEILRSEARPMSIRELERRVADQGIPADTYDVQRAVHRLVDSKLATPTPRYQVQLAG